MLKALAPLAIGVGLSLVQRLLGGGRHRNGPRPKPDYAGANIGDYYPWVYGLTTVGEIVIWKSDVRGSGKGKRRRKGKGKARVDAIIGICQGPITGVTKIFANNKLIYINTPYKTRDWLSQNCEGWALYTGTDTQGVCPLALANIPNPSAYRGIAYIEIKGMAVGDSGDELPQLRFEVARYPLSSTTVKKVQSSWRAEGARALRVVQLQGLEPEVVPIPALDETILGAFFEYQTVPVPNLAGDVAEENQGRIRLHTLSGSNPLLTGYETRYGQWHYKGQNLLPMPDAYHPMDIFPEIQFSNYGPYREITVSSQPVPPSTVGYYRAPHTYTTENDLQTTGVLTAYGSSVSVDQVATALLADYPAANSLIRSNLNDNDNPFNGLNQSVYGYQLRDGINVWQGLGKLFDLFNIDYSPTTANGLQFQWPGNRQPMKVPEHAILRKINDDTGEPESSVSFKINNSVDIPSEVRIVFRDVGRDGENSLAIAVNPHAAESTSTVTVNTDASMSFVNSQALAKEHLSRLMTKKYTVKFKLHSDWAIRIKLGMVLELSANLVDDTKNGWLPNTNTQNTFVKVRSISLDENLEGEVTGDYYGFGNYIENPAPVLTPIPTGISDGLPDSIEIEARKIQVPILDDPTLPLRMSYYGFRLTPANPTDEVIPCPRLEILEDTESIVSEESTAIAGNSYALMAVNFSASTVGKCVRLLGAKLSFQSSSNGAFQTYTESAFLNGAGTYFILNGVVGRARVATFSSNVYTLSDCIFGLSGTYSATAGSTHVLVKGATYDQQTDNIQVLNRSRQIKIYHPSASGLLSPLVDLTQVGETTRPYPITGIRLYQQPDGTAVLRWQGHLLGQSTRVAGRHIPGILPKYQVQYTINTDPTVILMVTTEEIVLPTTITGSTLNYSIQQLGDYGLHSPTAAGNYTYI